MFKHAQRTSINPGNCLTHAQSLEDPGSDSSRRRHPDSPPGTVVANPPAAEESEESDGLSGWHHELSAFGRFSGSVLWDRCHGDEHRSPRRRTGPDAGPPPRSTTTSLTSPGPISRRCATSHRSRWEAIGGTDSATDRAG